MAFAGFAGVLGRLARQQNQQEALHKQRHHRGSHPHAEHKPPEKQLRRGLKRIQTSRLGRKVTRSFDKLVNSIADQHKGQTIDVSYGGLKLFSLQFLWSCDAMITVFIAAVFPRFKRIRHQPN